MLLFKLFQNSFSYFLEYILKNISRNQTHEELTRFIFYTEQFQQFLSCLIVVDVVDRVGRKFMLILSALGMSLSLSALAIHYKLEPIPIESENAEWQRPVILILSHAISYSIGWGPVVMTVYTEIVHFNVSRENYVSK